ncbi:MAG TPA: iron ABC transporter permease [Gemmatimonadales bacterium]|jgi:iron complex transport system permease protein
MRVGRGAFVLGLTGGAIGAALLGLLVGGSHIPVGEALRAIAGHGDPSVRAIVLELRAPRIVLGFLVGGALAVSGAALQALVRNPLADPYLLGLSGGSSLGAVIAVAFGAGSVWGMPIAAFAGALLIVAAVYRLALVSGGGLDGRILLLAGVVAGAFAGALTSGILAVSESAQVRAAMLWLLGGLGGVGWAGVLALAVYSVPALVILAAESRTLDLLSLGDEPALHLGADVNRTRRRIYIAASLLTAAAVAAAGIIGFVGLAVPHAIRMVRGPGHRGLLPSAFVLGGAFLVVADAIARTLFAPMELPVGVITAMVGVPVFAVLLRRSATAVRA